MTVQTSIRYQYSVRRRSLQFATSGSTHHKLLEQALYIFIYLQLPVLHVMQVRQERGKEAQKRRASTYKVGRAARRTSKDEKMYS